MRTADQPHEGEHVLTTIAAARAGDVEEARAEPAAGVDGPKELEAADLDAEFVGGRAAAHCPGNADGEIDRAVVGFHPISRAGEAAFAGLGVVRPHDRAGRREIVQAGLGGVAMLAHGSGAGGDLPGDALRHQRLASAFAGEDEFAQFSGAARDGGARFHRADGGEKPAQRRRIPADGQVRQADDAADGLGHGAGVPSPVREEPEEPCRRDEPIGHCKGRLRAALATLRQQGRDAAALVLREHRVRAGEVRDAFAQRLRRLTERIAFAGELEEIRAKLRLGLGLGPVGLADVGGLESIRGHGRFGPGEW